MPTEQGDAPFEVFDLKPEAADVEAEVLAGLRLAEKTLSPKFFYNERGSELFEAITRLPEYYLTRTELSIFDASLDELAKAVPKGSCLVEYGSGSSLKIRKVLEAIDPAAYVPVDISGAHMVAMARDLVLQLQASFAQGIYLMPAFGRYDLAAEIIEVLKEERVKEHEY